MYYLCTRFVPGHSRPTAGRSARRPRTALAARAHPGKQEPDQAPEGLEPAVVSAPGGGSEVCYDVTRQAVEVLAIVTKAEAAGWLAEYGTPGAPGGAGSGQGQAARGPA